MMKVYAGVRRPDGVSVYVGAVPLQARRDLRNHSPTGFEWGYAGSGPAQLALALCVDVLGDDERALEVYQTFKWREVALFPKDGWRLTEDEIRLAIAECFDEVRP